MFDYRDYIEIIMNAPGTSRWLTEQGKMTPDGEARINTRGRETMRWEQDYISNDGILCTLSMSCDSFNASSPSTLSVMSTINYGVVNQKEAIKLRELADELNNNFTEDVASFDMVVNPENNEAILISRANLPTFPFAHALAKTFNQETMFIFILSTMMSANNAVRGYRNCANREFGR